MSYKVLLLGATGRTGKLVLKKALENGYQVHCLGRNIHRIPKQEGITLFEGDTTKEKDLVSAIANCDYVISTLNISRVNDFPWSRLLSPETYLSDTMNNLLKVAKSQSLKRMVICSAWGVGDSRVDIPWWFRWTIEHSNINTAYIDHERQEELLKRSAFNWTIVRPVGLINGKSNQRIRETFGVYPIPSLIINRISVADYLVQSLENVETENKVVVISKY